MTFREPRSELVVFFNWAKLCFLVDFASEGSCRFRRVIRDSSSSWRAQVYCENSLVILPQRVTFSGLVIAEMKPASCSFPRRKRHICGDEEQALSIAIFSLYWKAFRKVEWYKAFYCFTRANNLLRWKFSDELGSCMCYHVLGFYVGRSVSTKHHTIGDHQLEIFSYAFPQLCAVDCI